MRWLLPATWSLVLGVVLMPAFAQSPALAVPPSGVMGVTDDAMLTPEFWVQRLAQPDHAWLSPAAIAAQNRELLQRDPSMHDLRALPATLDRAMVEGWIRGISQLPRKPLFDETGTPVPQASLDAITASLALASIPATQATRYGLVVHRAALRSFPTTLRVFTTQGDHDIDRFQETAEFPGTPVVIAYASADGQWLFVVSARYAAWTRAQNIAQGSAADVFAYADRQPQRIVTGSSVTTVYTHESPAVSQLQLDMGTRVPVLIDHAADAPVNGQSPYTSHVVQLPVRGAGGALALAPALIPRQADTAAGDLPLTDANVLRQAFKFLGERYGWGHDYDGRDCSGFVSDVYRSMGVQMPRDTGRQLSSPVLRHEIFGPGSSHAARMKAVEALQVGDLVYIPGHVMMVIGRLDGEPYVIHDTTGISYRDGDGLRSVKLNAVSVTPLLPLMLDATHSYVDAMTGIVHLRPAG